MIKIFIYYLQIVNVLSQMINHNVECDRCLVRQQNGQSIVCPDDCFQNLDETTVDESDCILEQPDCTGYRYLCPKLTEVTNCNNDGIDGYTTFRLSVVFKENMNIKNLYAIYGDSNSGSLFLPESYQSAITFGKNIGGINPFFTNIIPESNYDSWLTIGIDDGDSNNLISSVGIDFAKWTITQNLEITDGAVFIMDPETIIVNNNEYLLGQITVRTNSNPTVKLNVQGKTIDISNSNSWNEGNINFPLISPTNIQNRIDYGCIIWYDGCNTCDVINGELENCSKLMCFTLDKSKCLSYHSP